MEEKRILANRYELIQKIGTGGMAVVYQAYDTALDRQVAVKLLRDEYIDNPDFIRQFQREAKAVAKLSHQNIVNIYDFGKSDGLMYLVMEYVNGCTLKELIAKQGPLPIQQILDYSIQLCYGLAQAHSHNIVHKDIKPHNIMIEHTHIAKITDFGIAQAINHLTMTHSNGVLGSAHYFSPEQARGEQVEF
ncbi:MAG: serine/threonine protein kinase, partial [Peptococcaceae bacterium]|nr:serine/threonine protein kinase [Peptococcaceae bacterium]